MVRAEGVIISRRTSGGFLKCTFGNDEFIGRKFRFFGDGVRRDPDSLQVGTVLSFTPVACADFACKEHLVASRWRIERHPKTSSQQVRLMKFAHSKLGQTQFTGEKLSVLTIARGSRVINAHSGALPWLVGLSVALLGGLVWLNLPEGTNTTENQLPTTVENAPESFMQSSNDSGLTSGNGGLSDIGSRNNTYDQEDLRESPTTTRPSNGSGSGCSAGVAQGDKCIGVRPQMTPRGLVAVPFVLPRNPEVGTDTPNMNNYLGDSSESQPTSVQEGIDVNETGSSLDFGETADSVKSFDSSSDTQQGDSGSIVGNDASKWMGSLNQ